MNTAGQSFCLFDTSIGLCGLLWSDTGILRLQLPEATIAGARRRLKEGYKMAQECTADQAPAWLQDALRLIQKHLQFGGEDLSQIPIDYSAASPFYKRVYQAALGIAAGQTLSYGQLATQLGSPGAARAVGQALGKNPLALIIPCHRVLAAGGKSGGFSAFGGVDTKHRLLALEAAAQAQARGDFQTLARDAALYLSKRDPQLGAIIARVGACTLIPKQGNSVFAALAEAIVYQQLTAKAAGTIFARFKQLFPETDFPTPAAVAQSSEETLRSAGLSRAKALALLDLAAKVLSGALPDMDALRRMSNDEIIAALTSVRGIGRWTVEMLLIFDLGRINVIPATDYGVRKGFSLVYRRKELPTPDALETFAQLWQPFPSIAAWYLWRALDLK